MEGGDNGHHGRSGVRSHTGRPSFYVLTVIVKKYNNTTVTTVTHVLSIHSGPDKPSIDIRQQTPTPSLFIKYLQRKCIFSVESDPEDDMFIMSYLVSDDIGLPC